MLRHLMPSRKKGKMPPKKRIRKPSKSNIRGINISHGDVVMGADEIEVVVIRPDSADKIVPSRMAGDTTTEAPPPDVSKKKKPKGK